MLHLSLIHTEIICYTEAWGWTYNSYLAPIRWLEKRVLWIITQKSLLPKQAMALKMAVSLRNIVNHILSFHSCIFSTSSHPPRNLMQCYFNLPSFTNICRERQEQFKGVKMWNSLPLPLEWSGTPTGQIQRYFLSLLWLRVLSLNLSRAPVLIVTLWQI